MKSYLNTLNEREQWMVIGAALCIILYLYYLFLYHPLNHQVNLKSKQLEEKIVTLKWMEQVRTQNHNSQTKKSLDNSQLLTLLSNQLKKNPALKFPYQVQQTSSGDIQITFDTVPFNSFIAWLKELNQEYVITIKQFDAERSKKSGLTRLTSLISGP